MKDMVIAILLITSDQPPTKADADLHAPQLLQAAIMLDLLPVGASIWFRGPWENYQDLLNVRETYRLPPISEAVRFYASTPNLRQESNRLQACYRSLSEQRLLWPDHQGRFSEELAIISQHQRIVGALMTIWSLSNPIYNRRALADLKGLLTEDEWERGVIPIYKEP